MKKLKPIFLLVLTMLFSSGIFAQNEGEFIPSGKPIVKIFSNYHSIFSDAAPEHAFQITRAYLGYEHDYNKNFSVKIILDVGNPEVGKLELTAFLKNAYLKYKYKKFTAYFGMISTTAFKVQEKFWGYRYIYKTFQDAYKFNASADIGMSMDYKFSDFLSADLAIINGKGYKQVTTDSAFKVAFGLTLKPVKNLFLRAYYDYYEKAVAQKTMAFHAGYSFKKLSIGAGYDSQLNHKQVDKVDFSGYSVFATYKVNKKWKVFGRYDKLSSVKIDNATNPWNFKKDGELVFVGFEFNPVKGVKLAPNYQGWIPANGAKSVLSGAYINCEIKL